MKCRNVKNDIERLDKIFKKKGITRRDAMKLAGISGASLLFGSTETLGNTENTFDNLKSEILIVGGGLSGISTAAKIRKLSVGVNITIIEPNPLSCTYQPGQTLVASGVWKESEVIYKRDDFIPKNVKIIKEKVVKFNPDSNFVITDANNTINYDVMIVAAGLKLNYGEIKGLEGAQEAYSIGNNKALLYELKNKGASSVYTLKSAIQMKKDIHRTLNIQKNSQNPKCVFTYPNTPLKAGSASLEMAFLLNSKLNNERTNNKSNLKYFTSKNRLFETKNYHESIQKQFKNKNIAINYKHNLIEVKKGIAIFENSFLEKNVFNESLKKYEMIPDKTITEVEFDFLHITPPMKSPDEIGKSAIGSDNGLVPVNIKTLQHKKYNNIFAIGDIADLSDEKTASSIKKQCNTVAKNTIWFIKHGSLEGTKIFYDGYVSYPIITDLKSAIFAEFNSIVKDTKFSLDAASLPLLDPTETRYIWWLLKVYLLKPLTVHGMLSGRI